MRRNPVISFLGGLTICGLILGVIYLLVLLMTFNLAGGETLQQIENQKIGLVIIAVVLAILAAITVMRFLRSGRKFTAYGISVLPILAVIIVTVYYVNNLTIHKQFSRTVWEQSKWKPFDMSATLAKGNKLIGLTRKQVKDMLGQGSEEYGDKNTDRGSILYLVENEWTLIIYLQKDKVVDTELRRPFLGV